MFVVINTSNGLPVYDQIVRQTKFAIADGAIRAGELIPSVRELAKDLAVNPNTVARAYRQLQSDELVETVRGMGLAVTQHARRKCQGERTRLVRERLRQVLDEATASGLSHEEVDKLIQTELQELRK